MDKKSLIQAQLEDIEEGIDESEGHDKSHLIGYRNVLRWVLDDVL